MHRHCLPDRTPSTGAAPHMRKTASHRAFLCAVALALLALPGVGLAFNRCVSNAVQLTQALADAETTPDLTTGIKLVAGTYATATRFAMVLSGTGKLVLISGGWSGPDCTTRLSGPAAATTLVGAGSNPTLAINYIASPNNFFVNVADLTLSNPTASEANQGSCFQHFGAAGNAGSNLNLSRVRIEHCAGTAALFVSNHGTATLLNLVAIDNPTSNAPVAILTYAGATTNLSQLTVVHDAGRPSLYLATFESNSQIYLSNSVVWSGAATAGRENIRTYSAAGTGIAFTRVHYDLLDGSDVNDVAPSHGDPGFVSATDPHLRGDSILVDSGVASPPGGTGTNDADHNPRVQGVAVDVGAYEYVSTTIFADGFDQ